MKRNKIYYLGVVLLLAGCSRDMAVNSDFLSGETKTPLTIEASLNTDQNQTRAADNKFETDDILLAYIRHTTGDTKGSYTSVTARLVAFKKGSVAMTGETSILETSDLTSVDPSNTATAVPLYWDDFSNSSSTDTDLRTSGHGLQSFYGYCYNGGTPTTELVNETGVLGWTVATDQSTSATTVKNQDLLWSAEQETVVYAHSTAREASSTVTHGTITIPYTHAMSEVTVKVTAKQLDGFTSNAPLQNTVLTLNSMNTVASLTAPAGTVTSTTPTSVVMYGDKTYSSGETRNYTAIVAPGTVLKVDEKLLDIVNVEDNNYTLKITSTMVAENTAWAVGHTLKTNNGTYIETLPGYNYHLDVTVQKAAVEVKATLANWITVNASGTGEIQLDDDDSNLYVNDTEIVGETPIQVINLDKDKFANASSFSLFWMKAASAKAAAVTTTANDSYTYATVSTFDNDGTDPDDVWTNSPELYWPNKTDNYYFRALAKYNSSSTSSVSKITSVGTFYSDKGTAVEQGSITDDATSHDILWGTTPLHYGKDGADYAYQRGMAIPPRKGGVPIAFFHAMSKITFNLTTTSDAEVTVNNAKVDLTDAKVTVSGIYTAGDISIETGDIKASGSTGSTDELSSGASYCVIPQDFSDYATDAMVIVTLKDGTTYKLKLKDCVVTTYDQDNNPVYTPITAWERGKFYTYTIHLEKEKITFRALIKDWEEVTGSGNGNLEWD